MWVQIYPETDAPTGRAWTQARSGPARCAGAKTITLPIQIAGIFRRLRVSAPYVSYAADLAVLPSAIGLYGSPAFTVSRRTREIAIRMAVGAAPASVLAMIAREGAGRTPAGFLMASDRLRCRQISLRRFVATSRADHEDPLKLEGPGPCCPSFTPFKVLKASRILSGTRVTRRITATRHRVLVNMRRHRPDRDVYKSGQVLEGTHSVIFGSH
jgi:hypothetical protein